MLRLWRGVENHKGQEWNVGGFAPVLCPGNLAKQMGPVPEVLTVRLTYLDPKLICYFLLFMPSTDGSKWRILALSKVITFI